jgi:hypothetical protein
LGRGSLSCTTLAVSSTIGLLEGREVLTSQQVQNHSVVDGKSGAETLAHWLSGDWVLSERKSVEDSEERELKLGILKGRNFLNLNWTPFVGLWVLVWSRCRLVGVRVAVNVDIDTLT